MKKTFSVRNEKIAYKFIHENNIFRAVIFWLQSKNTLHESVVSSFLALLSHSFSLFLLNCLLFIDQYYICSIYWFWMEPRSSTDNLAHIYKYSESCVLLFWKIFIFGRNDMSPWVNSSKFFCSCFSYLTWMNIKEPGEIKI